MTNYFLEAEDVLFFRDGRPFNAGEDHHAASRFPPSPSVIQGVFRSHYLVHRGVALDDKETIRQLIGDGSDYKGLRLGAPLLARLGPDGQVTRFFPTPADACLVKEDSGLIQPRQLAAFPHHRLAGQGLKYLPTAPKDSPISKGDLGGYVSEADFAAYFLHGKAVATHKEADLFEREARLGIQLESGSRSTREGMLYEAEFIRPCEGVGLLVEMDGLPDFPESGVMRAGGEGRALRYRAIQPPAAAVKLAQAGDSLPARFKVYFASPAWFEDGWKPKDWSNFFDGEVKLVAAAVGGYEVIGGYDLLDKKQKAASRWLPSGSILYFENGGAVRLKQAAMTQRGAEIGCGRVVIGTWQPAED